MHRTEIVKGVASIKQGFLGVAPKHLLGASLNGPPPNYNVGFGPCCVKLYPFQIQWHFYNQLVTNKQTFPCPIKN